MDAIRDCDGMQVILKRIPVKIHRREIDIGRFVAREEFATDPRNHCSPLLDVIDIPDAPEEKILVFQWYLPANLPDFETVGESIEFFRQVLEGLEWMHAHHIGHLDCCIRNIMMHCPGIFPKGTHPTRPGFDRKGQKRTKHLSRRQLDVKYYFIDYGLSVQYKSPDEPRPMKSRNRGQYRSAPEYAYASERPFDPFPLDVWCIGWMIKAEWLDKYAVMEFMRPMVNSIMQDAPQDRPTAGESLQMLTELISTLGTEVMESFLIPLPPVPPSWFSRKLKSLWKVDTENT